MSDLKDILPFVFPTKETNFDGDPRSLFMTKNERMIGQSWICTDAKSPDAIICITMTLNKSADRAAYSKRKIN